MRESSLIVFNNEIIDYQIGDTVSVKFDFSKIWTIKDDIIMYPSLLELYHVHPRGMLYYSELDRQVMKGFSLALGKDIFNFNIITFNEDNLHDLNYEHVHYSYDLADNKVNHEDSILKVSPNYLIPLKLMSYGDTIQ